MSISYPGESAAYRSARNALLQEEVALRGQIERIAALRRSLPDGGTLKEDYQFTALDGAPTRISGLFSDKSATLAVYSLMFGLDAQSPCPMCSSLLDGLAGQADHVGQLINFVVVAAASPDQLTALAYDRGWSDLTLLSAQGTSYQADYHGELADGAQIPMMNIFRKTQSGISHFWGTESFFADIDGQPRHLDQIWPLWNMLDMTPDGRGADWYPGLSYAN